MKFFKQFFPYLLITIVLALFLSSCASRVVQTNEAKDSISQEKNTKPITTEVLPVNLEVLEDFHLRIPESISIGEAFELRVTTIGGLGTKPFFEEDESLQFELSSSTGKIEPSSFSIQGGIGETKATLSDVAASTEMVELTLSLSALNSDLNQNLITKKYTLNIK